MDQKLFTLTSCSKCSSVNKVKLEKLQQQKGICGHCQTDLIFHELVSEVDLEGLKKLIANSHLQPVVIDFWAPWCGPCVMFAPTYEKASKEFAGKISFVKINTQNFPEASEFFGIRGIPTLAIYKNGKEVIRQSGAFPYDSFLKWLNQYAQN